MSHKVYREEKPHPCDKCFEIFDNEKSLEQHKIREHSDSVFTIEICNPISNEDENLQHSILTVHGTNVKSESDIDQGQGQSQGQCYKCALCDESFTQQIDLELHMFNAGHHKDKIHVELEPSYIKVEDESGTREDNEGRTKAKKVRRKRGTAPEVDCKICGKTVTTPKSLQTHMRIHTGEKPFKCNECGKAFTQRGGLRTHLFMHTGAKPYPCTICDKSFTTSSAVKRHHRTHTGERPYQCPKCDKSFKVKEGLQNHLFKHKDSIFKCHECGKQFSTPSGLKRHGMVHKNHRPHKCTKCDKSFAVKARLERHMGVHARHEEAKKRRKSLSKKNVLQKLKNGKMQCRRNECNKCGETFWKKN